MPKIPTVRAIGRTRVEGIYPVARINANEAGSGLRALGAATEQFAEAENRAQVSRARSDLLILKSQQDKAYDEDDDHDTIEERYSAAMSEGLSEIAGGIDNPRLRNMFVNDGRTTVAAGEARIGDLAWRKKSDHEVASLSERLTEVREAGITGEDADMASANSAAINEIQSAHDMGYLTDVQRANLTKQFKENLAVGRLEMMEPRERLAALNQDWAKNLPSDKRAKLIRDAKAAERDAKSMTVVDGYMDKGLNIAQGMAAAQKIKDPVLRKEVEKRFQYDYGVKQKADIEAQTELHKKYFGDIATGQMRFEDIPKEDRDLMDPKIGVSLVQAQGNSVKAAKVPFNAAHHDELMQLKAMAGRNMPGAGVRLRERYLELSPDLSESQNKAWSSASVEGVMPPEVESGLTDVQAIAAKIPKKSDAERRRILLGYMGDWRKEYIRKFQKEPTDDDRDKAIDRAILEYDPGFMEAMRPVYLMSDEDKTDALTIMRDDNPAAFDKAAQYFKARGYQPTHAQFMEAYSILNASD